MALFLGAALMGIAGPAQAAEVTAAEILERAAMVQSSQHRVLNAVLRNDDQKFPLRLVLNGSEIRYEFNDPGQVFVVKLGPKSRIDEVTGEGHSRIPTANYDARVRDTDVTFEDLALRFLYWKNAKFLEDERVGIVACHKLELHPGAIPSQYGTVLAWIIKDAGALKKAECYDRKGKLAARFETLSFKTLPSDGARIFGSMRIERMENGKSKDVAPTYLDIKGEEPR